MEIWYPSRENQRWKLFVIAFVRIVMFANYLNMRKNKILGYLIIGWFSLAQKNKLIYLDFINFYNNQNQLVFIKMIITKQH